MPKKAFKWMMNEEVSIGIQQLQKYLVDIERNEQMLIIIEKLRFARSRLSVNRSLSIKALRCQAQASH